MRTIVYADGGCDPNPGPGGWGVVIQDPAGTVELHGGERATTNNRMELTAAIRALEHFPEGAQIEMRCDSQYVVKSVTEWMRGWKARGWRTATGPVKNIDLMQRLDTLAAARDVRWTWVRGHAGEAGNERADRLAALGRREALSGKASGETVPPPADAAPAIAPPAAQPETTQVTLSADLARAVSRAAARAGISPQAYLEDAVRLALELKPPGVARVRAELQKAS
ncbi:ribonuclease HI [Methylorubrum rhodesianum]|jgi:ribonuclease HI|uniref:Ribonuclease H n=1 Tax=Methylorubrum rhodesianum TaxID=29427 RepID=A0ABU9Z6S8_9HYPH|nr:MULTISPECIES: ribonuclease HI [Methylorubrum]MBY0140247.1 ribonuclease HI [Methylorubrum populi]MRI54034.1 ribonuclease HI [Methylobacterium sp. DB1607]MBB5763662.1 ribonuclease HI [Methylorubrum rhodesianum]MBI1689785.1 ribonuclease HI [Methylorubrum sp. DB1722]MBK3402119.1 ribonuclease HI [Methylorubrum rhodesianum]